MERFISAPTLVVKHQPDVPVHCIRPFAAKRAAAFFKHRFPGDVLYAVKANPHPSVLDAVYDAGVRSFDVASLPELELVATRYPDARLAYMHPVKSRHSIERAYTDFGVRIFAIDCLQELEKILAVTGQAKDLTLIVRLAVSSAHAQHNLAGKFGSAGKDAVELLRAARNGADELGISFHVGSQCMRPDAYRSAMTVANELICRARVTVDIVDVGGGFPSQYPGLTPPPMEAYIATIEEAFGQMLVLNNADLWCEPGRAICAEAGSQIARVDLRKDQSLYINDGAYGALFDAAHCNLIYPARLLTGSSDQRGALIPFKLFGPTCDAIDTMDGPFLLPDNIEEGDYIEFGLTGAYGAALATTFNGYGQFIEAELCDEPLTSMYIASVTETNILTLPIASGVPG